MLKEREVVSLSCALYRKKKRREEEGERKDKEKNG
jgi:hypothetical protein